MSAANGFRVTVSRTLPGAPAATHAALTDIATAPRIWFTTSEGRMERAEIDPRPGGAFRFDERRGDTLARHWGSFSEVSADRIAFGFRTEEAEPPSPVEITLDAVGSGTRLTLGHDLAGKWRPWEERIAAGWTAILDNLEAVHAEAPRRLALSRHFPCPASSLWAAWSDPDRLPRWWGPRGFTCETREIRLGAGGLWRFDMIGPDGTRYANRHRYTRVEPETRIDYRLDDDGAGQHAFDASVRLHAEGAGSHLTLTMVTDTPEHRDMMVEFGAIEMGYTTLDCLAEEALRAEGDHAVSLTRSYAAPPDRLRAAWTDPARRARWQVPGDVALAEASPRGRPEHVLATRIGGQGARAAPKTDLEVTFEPAEAGTRQILLLRRLPSADAAAAATESWSPALDRLAAATQ